jgi:hypothetical protein
MATKTDEKLPETMRGGAKAPDSLKRDTANHGVLDPAEAGHPLPEGLERKRAGPLNKDTGRRTKSGGV